MEAAHQNNPKWQPSIVIPPSPTKQTLRSPAVTCDHQVSACHSCEQAEFASCRAGEPPGSCFMCTLLALDTAGAGCRCHRCLPPLVPAMAELGSTEQRALSEGWRWLQANSAEPVAPDASPATALDADGVGVIPPAMQALLMPAAQLSLDSPGRAVVMVGELSGEGAWEICQLQKSKEKSQRLGNSRARAKVRGIKEQREGNGLQAAPSTY